MLNDDFIMAFECIYVEFNYPKKEEKRKKREVKLVTTFLYNCCIWYIVCHLQGYQINVLCSFMVVKMWSLIINPMTILE